MPPEMAIGAFSWRVAQVGVLAYLGGEAVRGGEMQATPVSCVDGLLRLRRPGSRLGAATGATRFHC